MANRRPCEGPCGRNRDLRFFPPDARRTDGISTRCVTCKKKRRSIGSRDQRLQETYGITQAEFNLILESQGGVCAICKGKRPSYDLDHDHKAVKAGKTLRQSVRGVLCRRCNRRLLPASLDDCDVLFAAQTYLISPPARQVISA